MQSILKSIVKNLNIYRLDEKSDVYSIGVLFWEISSGRPPFYVEGQQYEFRLAVLIGKGYREKIVPGTPKDYVKIYTGKYNLFIYFFQKKKFYLRDILPLFSRLLGW